MKQTPSPGGTAPGNARFARLSENVPRIVINIVRFQEGDEFVFEIAFLVMLFLFADVCDHPLAARIAHAECTESLLSLELEAHPFRGILFHLLDHGRMANRSGKRD